MENTPEGPRSKEADGDTLLIEDVEVRPISDPQDPLQKVIPNGHQDSCQDKPQDNPQESPQDRPQSIPQERPQERTQDISEEIHTEQSTPTPDEDQPQDDWVHELHTAIENNDADAVATLLDNDGALEQLYFYRFNLEFDVEYGVTPLTLAAGLGLGSIVQLLLDRGANILTKTTNTESTAFFTAIRNGHKHIVEMLFNKGGSELLEEPNDSGRMPLGAAARNGHADVLKLLIDKGANTNYADDKGYTALHLASMQEDPAIVKFLLDNGAEIHTANAEGLTALHFAAEYQQTACINTLLAGGPIQLPPKLMAIQRFTLALDSGILMLSSCCLKQSLRY
ncbi:uncharacterized protein N7529_001196 [Penicillium soppii]|uniref:uncharacterized protein n=1 Tax=Penicillium soppii TaxID=69789 RepID=UPI002549896A|nr:uncharacterized protein N7529_001196 [Penicillium soppii]KAJ5882524.1 hypothetical protein N7529_001196 [Penicillium soppii]